MKVFLRLTKRYISHLYDILVHNEIEREIAINIVCEWSLKHIRK
jgi:hypothetical protein